MNIENKININILKEWRFKFLENGVWFFHISETWNIKYDLINGIIQLCKIEKDGSRELFDTYYTKNNLLLSMERYRDLLLKVIWYYHQ